MLSLSMESVFILIIARRRKSDMIVGTGTVAVGPVVAPIELP